MIRHFLAAAAALFMTAACTPSDTAEDAVSASAASAPRAIVKTKKSDGGGIPSEITIPSSVGEVTFRHQAHIERSIGCVQCHHQIDAKKLNTPHPQYLESSWINCKVCHDESGKAKQDVYACSECHRANPTNIADETLSPKVVIHKQCWNCHQVSTGSEASKSCAFCHSGKKTL